MFKYSYKKTNCWIIVFILLSLCAGYSFSAEKQYNWVLKGRGVPLLQGRVKVSSTTDRSGCLRGYERRASDLGCCTRSTILCSSSDYCTVEEVSKITLEFTQNNPNQVIPPIFSLLFESSQFSNHHRFTTRYTLKGRTASAPGHFAWLMCYLCCFACYDACENYAGEEFFPEQRQRQILQEHASLTKSLPPHVSINNISLTHTSCDGGNHSSGRSSSQTVDNNTMISDLFMNSPLAQAWLTSNLGSSLDLHLPVVVPELFTTPVNAHIQSQQPQLSESFSVQAMSASLTHILTFTLENGVVIHYHLSYFPENQKVKILEVSISAGGFSLVFNVEGYSSDMPPHYSSIVCDCPGACSCSCNSSAFHTSRQ